MNNSNAIRNIGFLYEDGKAFNVDFEKAIEHYKRSIKLKNYYGYINLGLLYLKGDGVNKDFSIAFNYFRLACEKNIPGGFYNIGKMYMKGNGVEKSYKEAEKYLKIAKKYDHMDAIYYLGYLYYLMAKETENNEKLYQKAELNFKISGQQGSPESLFKLGYLYEKGLGVEKDYKKSLFYYELAIDNLNYSAVYKLATEHLNGEITETNINLSIKYFAKCIDTKGEKMRIEKDGLYNIRFNKHYYPGSNDLGLIFLLNNDVFDFEKAVDFIGESANSEYQYAQNNYGLLCEFFFLKINLKMLKIGTGKPLLRNLLWLILILLI